MAPFSFGHGSRDGEAEEYDGEVVEDFSRTAINARNRNDRVEDVLGMSIPAMAVMGFLYHLFGALRE